MRKGLVYRECAGVGLMHVPAFEELGGVKACFTTRIGGVSTGECQWLNMSYKRTDSREQVDENLRRVCAAMGLQREDAVYTLQVHQNDILVCDASHKGLGITRPEGEGYDAAITNVPGVLLTKHTADCVPVLLYAPGKACGAVHAGWKSTVMDIAYLTVEKMCSCYGLQPQEIYAAIGPSIGPCCFEVGEEVAEKFPQHTLRGGAKPHVDLWQANVDQLLRAGVPEQNITLAGECTYCEKDQKYFSHRRDHGHTGLMAACIALE